MFAISLWIPLYSARTHFHESARISVFQSVRAGTKGEINIRRANYIFGYFVVLPAWGLRNDRLFINDLSLSILWTIILRFLGSLTIGSPLADPLPVRDGTLTFRIDRGFWRRVGEFALRIPPRPDSSAKRFTTWFVKRLGYLRD